MGKERWDKQWEIFHDALEQAVDQRGSFLETACGEDIDLKEAVLKLLQAHELTNNFLEDPLMVSVDALNELEPEVMIGQRVGPYIIQSVIGEGGMGVVYAASQAEPVKRRVALKVIKFGMNTREVVARFEQERQALAVMNHPNVAKVYDAGATEDGRPYFVMEYVEGSSITEYCDSKRLNNRQRLEMCRDVFAGIQHAHQKGLIHRDIKPSNVLIEHQQGERPVVKIIDFGIAKATDQYATEKTLFTQLGRLIGTPAYMSPEQAVPGGVDVDTRSDIYSLSVLLYELLTGTVPFETKTLLSAGYAQMQRIIREDEPPTPSTRLSHLDADTISSLARVRRSSSRTIKRELEGDLDWIILKGLEKAPSRRYDSVTALADDIERHLNHEPVVARRPNAAYRTGKFIRRHTFGVNIALFIFILAVGFVTSTILQSRELARALEAAQTERAKAQQVADFLIDLLTETDPNIAQGETITVREALDRGAEKIGGQLEDQPIIKMAILIQMAEIYRELGSYDQAEIILEQVQGVRESRDVLDRTLEGDMHQVFGTLYHDKGDYEQAELHYELALRLRRAEYGDHAKIIEVLDDFGVLQTDLGNYEKAGELLSEALEMSRRVHPGDHADVSEALQDLAYNNLRAGNLAPAGPLFEEAVAMVRRLYGDRSNQMAAGLNFQATYLRRAGLYGEAVAVLQEALSIYEETLGSEHSYVAATLSNLSGSLTQAGRLRESLEYAKRAVALLESLFDEAHPNLGTAYYNLASTQLKLGLYVEAEQAFRQTLSMDRDLLGSDHPNVISDTEQLAMTVKRRGNLEEAEALQRDVLARRVDVLGADHPLTAIAHANLASVISLGDQLEEAEEHSRRAVEILEPLEPDSPRMLLAKTQVAFVQFRRGQFDEAELSYLELLDQQRNKFSADHPDIARSLHGLGAVYLSQGKPAATEFEEALRIREAVLGVGHPDTVATREALRTAQ